MSKPISKRIKNWLIYVLVVIIVRFMRSSSRLTSIKLMHLLGRLAYRLASGEREKTIRHLSLAFNAEKTDEEIKQLSRRVFLNLATVAADAIRLPRIAENGLDELVTAERFEILQDALSAGNGAILLTGHFGNWELLGAWLAKHGVPLKVVGRTAYDPRLDKMIVDTRNQLGYTNIARGKGTREIVRSLRQGYAIALLVDQDTKVDGRFVKFFGRPAHTATGPVVLAQKFNAPIVPVFIRLKSDLTYHIEFMEPLTLVHTGEAERDLVENIQKCSDIYERMIRKYPEQWVWMHERWKKQPDTVAN